MENCDPEDTKAGERGQLHKTATEKSISKEKTDLNTQGEDHEAQADLSDADETYQPITPEMKTRGNQKELTQESQCQKKHRNVRSK